MNMKSLIDRLFQKNTVKVHNQVPEVTNKEMADEWLPFSIEELYWEIRAEEEETDQTFRVIMKRRFEEAGLQPGTTMWEDAVEGIREVDADVAIGYADSVGEDEIQKVEEWEEKQIDAAIVRMVCRELEQTNLR